MGDIEGEDIFFDCIEDPVEEEGTRENGFLSRLRAMATKVVGFQKRKKKTKRREDPQKRRERAHRTLLTSLFGRERAAEFLQVESKGKNALEAEKSEVAGGSHIKADEKELGRFRQLEVFDTEAEYNPQIHPPPISCRVVRTWKKKGGEIIAKSRMVAKGFQDVRLGWLETYAGTADFDLVLSSLQYAVSRGWIASSTDIATAFLQAPLKEEVWVRLPKDLDLGKLLPELNGRDTVRLRKTMYGLNDSPRKFGSFLRSKLRALGWTQLAESILELRDSNKNLRGLLIIHVDDLLLLCPSGERGRIQEGISSMMEMDPWEELELGARHQFCMWDGHQMGKR